MGHELYPDPQWQRFAELWEAFYPLVDPEHDETPLDPTMFDAPSGAFFVGYVLQRVT